MTTPLPPQPTDPSRAGAGAGPAAVVLAAGGGTRWAGGEGDHKLLADFRGRPVVAWAVEHATGSGLYPVWVVTGAVDVSSVLPPSATLLANPRWQEGQATSLQVAVGAARRAGVTAIVVGLGDQPLVPAFAWRAVASAGGDVAVATYDGMRRNPVKLSAAVWDLLPVTGDEGARTLMRSRPDLVREVPCQGDPVDIDTKEDLQRWS